MAACTLQGVGRTPYLFSTPCERVSDRVGDRMRSGVRNIVDDLWRVASPHEESILAHFWHVAIYTHNPIYTYTATSNAPEVIQHVLGPKREHTYSYVGSCSISSISRNDSSTLITTSNFPELASTRDG